MVTIGRAIAIDAVVTLMAKDLLRPGEPVSAEVTDGGVIQVNAPLVMSRTVPLEEADALVESYAARLDALFSGDQAATFTDELLAEMHRLLSEAIADVCG